MKYFPIKYLLALFVALSAGSIQMPLAANNDDCCRTSCYECGCEPLYCGAWGLQVDAGIRPVIWRNRDDFFTVNCLSTSVVNDIGQLPKFNKLYKLPWQVGVQASYALSTNTNVFVEFNYAQAKFKHDESLVTVGTSSLVLNLSKYKVYDGYVGVRYYWDRWCDRLSLFLGGKVGFLHHKKISTGVFTGVVACNATTASSSVNDLFSRKTSFAGGGQVGLDYCICGNWSLVLTFEAVAACGPMGVSALALTNPDAANLGDAGALIVPGATELFFPITLGVKYNF